MNDLAFVQSFSFRLWSAKRSTKYRDYGYMKVECFPYIVLNTIRDFKHAMRQNYKDLKRRGLSNREGYNNRSQRKHLNCA